MEKKAYCVIMAGGVGHRLWPISVLKKPKQFMDMLGTGKSCIRSTFERVSKDFDIQNIFIITRTDFRDIIYEQIPELPLENILCEPLNRNTATCIAYASYKISKLADNPTMLIIPADHVITNDDIYLDNIKTGMEFVEENGGLLTIGIEATRPETEFGYIQVKDVDDENKVVKVKTFIEKPDIDMAKIFMESGDFLWNSGIFIWKVKDIIAEFKEHMHNLHNLFTTDSKINTEDEEEFIKSVYVQCYNIPIDVGIMEKSSEVFVLKGGFGWTDLSNWDNLFRLVGKDDEHNNVSNTDNIILSGSENCSVFVENDTKIILQGIKDVIVAEKNGYIMICSKKDEYNIRQFSKLWKVKDSEES